eukprot:TCONS_00057938-protein
MNTVLLILFSITTGASWVSTMHQDRINALHEDMDEVDPHYYKPLPLPLKDAIIYVKKYGPYAAEKRIKVKRRHSKKSIKLMECKQRDRPPKCERQVNGCGSGFTESVPLLFRDKFTSSCNKHDVCYDCGFARNWTRSDCDNTLYQDAVDACECAYPGFLASAERLACREMAESIYMAVRVFSESYFSTHIKDFCLNDCVLSYGSPKLSNMV